MGYELKIVLASTSPRRVKLLQEQGFSFTVAEPRSEESSSNPDPAMRAVENAEAKVLSVSEEFPDSLIIGADTIVYLEGEFLGKPACPEEAKAMLRRLSGKTHSVFTGVALLDTSNSVLVSDYKESHVMFLNLSQSTIDVYVKSGEPLDKAGAYAIQGKGAALIDGYTGSWSNIVGLPTEILCKMLRKKGYTA